MKIEEHIPLAPFTTFHIGGPARFFVRVANETELKEALAFAHTQGCKVFILGGGSNVLINDAGFDGLVIKVESRGVEFQNNVLVAGAGEEWDTLVSEAVARGLWGIENLSGVPGSMGGAVVQNIGAYGQALSQTFLQAEVYDTQSESIQTIDKAAYASGYRESLFKHHPGRYVVLRVLLELSAEPVPNLSYKDLAHRFQNTAPQLLDIRSAVLEIRANKFPDLSVEGTAGSFFKNPVLPKAQAEALAARYPGVPLFALPESSGIKIPLGWFLDYRHGVLDMRDVRVGGARMYEKQFLVLVAQKNTSAEDVKKLSALVQEKVFTTLGITIEPEVCIV